MTSHRGHTPTEVIDPVCKMSISPADAAGAYDYKGTRYYFCHASCLDRFKADPEEFLSETARVVPAPPGGPSQRFAHPSTRCRSSTA